MNKITGKVMSGRKIGRVIGFPTLNLHYDGHERGVYVGEVNIDGEVYCSAVMLGERPTFYDVDVGCEAFLLDFDEEIKPGTYIEVEVFERIRDIKKFNNFTFLKNQIAKDADFVKNWFDSKEKK